MLINHDFDWDADLDASSRPGVAPTSGTAAGPTAAPRRPGGHIRPGEQVVIIERHRGLSRSTLILALVALVLSLALAIPKALHRNAAVTTRREQMQPDRSSPAQADGHAGKTENPPYRRLRGQTSHASSR
jgi:hypothetical protein